MAANTQLPLQLKVGLRDLWEKPDAPAQQALKDVKSVLGIPIQVDLQIGLLWSELEPLYTDKQIFVPTIVDVVRAWTVCLQSRVEDEKDEEWAEHLLDVFKKGPVTAYLETSKQAKVLSTSLSTAGSPFFRIIIPAVKPPFYNAPSAFASSFAAVFEPPAPTQPSGIPSAGAAASGAMSSQAAASQKNAQLSIRSKPASLPRLESLSRPEVLLGETAPYHLLVELTSDKIRIMGSHEPSVNLIFEYFQKWTRNDSNSVPNTPCLTSELKESNFGYGILRDTIIIERRTKHLQLWRELNPVLILAFIESVLGYDMLNESSANTFRWHFKRTEPFE